MAKYVAIDGKEFNTYSELYKYEQYAGELVFNTCNKNDIIFLNEDLERLQFDNMSALRNAFYDVHLICAKTDKALEVINSAWRIEFDMKHDVFTDTNHWYRYDNEYDCVYSGYLEYLISEIKEMENKIVTLKKYYE